MSLGNILTSNTVATACARGTPECGSMALYLDGNVASVPTTGRRGTRG